jgi:enoyl-CoA hydratase/carnithine racemase/acyl-CoA synthetase (AMP-forming)/AMP-acid ligase II
MERFDMFRPTDQIDNSRTKPLQTEHHGQTNSGRSQSDVRLENGESQARRDLPNSLTARQHGPVALLRLSRPAKRNALDDATIAGIESFFSDPPEQTRAIILHADGKHFSAGVDLSTVTDVSGPASVRRSQFWYRAFDRIENGRVPVVAVLQGGIIGGGLELAAAAHIRIAERSAYYALPESTRGIFVGGGGAVRIPRLIGTTRMIDMMLTGRTYSAEEGLSLGFSQYLVDDGHGLAKAIELAERITTNTVLSNFAIVQALPRIARSDPEGGFLLESLLFAIAVGDDEAKERVNAFFKKADNKGCPSLQRKRAMMMMMKKKKKKKKKKKMMRVVALPWKNAIFEPSPDGSLRVRNSTRLGPYPGRLTDQLRHWATVTPDRVLFASRDGERWRKVTYLEALKSACVIGQASLDRGLSVTRPVLILSGNGIEHGLLSLGCLHVGIPFAPLSTAYSLISTDFAKLRDIVALVHPGLVFADDGDRYAAALSSCTPEDVEVVTVHGDSGRRATHFDALLAAAPTNDVEAAAVAVNPDTIAKLLFTSGSTGFPKGVINTHRMWCSALQMVLACYPALAEEPPVLVDWLPWNHILGGTISFGIALFNGGTLYIDDGKPLPGQIEATVRNLREVAPLFYSNVPRGYEELVPWLRRHRALRENFFSRVRVLQYSGASIAQHICDAFDELALETIGERIPWVAMLGSTEAGPIAVHRHSAAVSVGCVGLPPPGVALKLTPTDSKMEVRVQSPSVTPGYWRRDDLTSHAFDEDGFLRTGDALDWAEAGNQQTGFRYDGRLAEDCKLATGTGSASARSGRIF